MASSEEKAAFTFLPLGGIIQEFRVAGQNIVLGFPTEKLYHKYNAHYFGATIGRTTNRLKNAVIDNVNGRSYNVTTGRGPHSIHGGKEGWSAKVFKGPKPINRNGKEGLEFKYLSKDGEEGYPGTVELRVWYTAAEEEEEGQPQKTVLEIEYEAEFVGDECEETVVGVTNHRQVELPEVSCFLYFNLGDCPTIEGTEAVLETDNYLPTDSEGIPTGTIERYTATEVKKPFFMDDTYPDIDDCFVMDTDPSSIPLDTRTRPAKLLASFKHLVTKLHLEVFSTEPAFQFYTGKYVDVPAVGGAPARGSRSGFCVEPSRYVNAPNEPEWRSMCLLKKGQVWGAKSVYKAWKE
ncbi:aldose epimerase family protein [Emydomyces testavorans]|uniref:Aldose epimerase family protein n=1 Tax=Emydomyces testavorans TaxID=2070801 RepID=A0AAF0IL44_9EURO|nr:aldose epimerase family protein [Emydomyces testavorans]